MSPEYNYVKLIELSLTFLIAFAKESKHSKLGKTVAVPCRLLSLGFATTRAIE